MTDLHADIASIRQLRTAVVNYRHQQAGVLGDATREIQATQASLHAKAQRWRAELASRQAQLQECQARAAAAAAGPPGAPRGYVDCTPLVWAVDEARERLEVIAHWQSRVEAAVQSYSGAAGHFRNRVESGIPQTVAHLESLIRALQAARGLQIGH